jgi:alkylation response protein AidB-like acyl-CoA dehydrogenase
MLNANQFFACRLPSAGIEEIYGSREPGNFAAASLNPPMAATVVEGGYVLNGRAPLASLVEEAPWMVVLGMVTKEGEVKEAFIAYTRKSEIEIVDTWDSLGMRGTGSHDVLLQNVFVPRSRTWPMQPDFEPNEQCRGSLYRFPGMGAIGVVIAPIMLGIAQVAIPVLVELGQRKTPFVSAVPLRDRAAPQSRLGRALAAYHSGRVYFYDTIVDAWEKTKSNHTFTAEERSEIHLAGIHACQSSVRAVELVFEACGTTGVYTRSPLERCFRDIQTLRQHGFMSENRYETVGQVQFGLPPDLPLVLF